MDITFQVDQTMKLQRYVLALVLMTLVMGWLATTEASAYARRIYAPVPGMAYYPAAPVYGYGFYPAYPYANYGYGSAFGVYPSYGADYYYPKTVPDDFQLGADARKRASLYPATPNEPRPSAPATDMRRVMFEISVPHADAIVTFDGVQTKQTGLNRVFMTPPMEEGKEYSITIDARWPTDGGVLSKSRPRTFTVMPGQTVQHTFIE